jgi:hypothetical protein
MEVQFDGESITEWRVVRGAEHDATGQSYIHAMFHVDEILRDQECLKYKRATQGNTGKSA